MGGTVGEINTFSSVALASSLLPKLTPSQEAGMLISGGSWICRQSGVNTGFSKVVRPESQNGSNWIQLETVFEGAWTPGWQPLLGDSNYFILGKISSLKEPGGGGHLDRYRAEQVSPWNSPQAGR